MILFSKLRSLANSRAHRSYHYADIKAALSDSGGVLPEGFRNRYSVPAILLIFDAMEDNKCWNDMTEELFETIQTAQDGGIARDRFIAAVKHICDSFNPCVYHFINAKYSSKMKVEEYCKATMLSHTSLYRRLQKVKAALLNPDALKYIIGYTAGQKCEYHPVIVQKEDEDSFDKAALAIKREKETFTGTRLAKLNTPGARVFAVRCIGGHVVDDEEYKKFTEDEDFFIAALEKINIALSDIDYGYVLFCHFAGITGDGLEITQIRSAKAIAQDMDLSPTTIQRRRKKILEIVAKLNLGEDEE